MKSESAFADPTKYGGHPKQMRVVVLESPYAGDVDANVEYAREALLDCLLRGEAPMASHLLYTQVLDDTDKIERARGINAGHAWMHRADAVVVYEDLGVTEGMQAGIRTAEIHGVSVERRRIR